MKPEDLKEHVDARFDRLEDKLDKYASRTTKNEADISWLRGYSKTATTLFLTLALAAILYAVGIKQ